MPWYCWLGGRKGIRPAKMGWWRWALVSPDGVAPSRMVGVSASVNLPLHHKVQKFSSGTGSPGWSRKKGRKTVVVCVCVLVVCLVSYSTLKSVLPSQSFSPLPNKLNPTQQNQICPRKQTLKTKPMFGCLVRNLAWKWNWPTPTTPESTCGNVNGNMTYKKQQKRWHNLLCLNANCDVDRGGAYRRRRLP